MIQNNTRQQAEKQKQKNILKQKKQTQQKEKARTRKRKWKTGRKDERKKQERDKEREREKRREAQKRLKRNKGRHWKINKNAPFLGGKQFFVFRNQKRKQKKENKEGLGPSAVALRATSLDP